MGLEATEKPGEFCVTALAWVHADGTRTEIAEVYCGPEEVSAYGPAYSHDYALDLWAEYAGHVLVVRTYRTRDDGNAIREYTGITVYRASADAKAWIASPTWAISTLVASRP